MAVKFGLALAIAPFAVAMFVVIAIFLPGHSSDRILADLFSRVFDKLLWPTSQEIILSKKKPRG